MAAQCAVCLELIVKGTKFVLAGTEVFHVGCATVQGTHQSIGNRRHQQLVELEADRESARREIRRATVVIEDAKRSLVAANERYDRVLADFASAQANERSWRRRFEEVRQELSTMEVERDQARRELAINRQLSAQPATPVVQPPKDSRDDTEIRFSLIELDSD